MNTPGSPALYQINTRVWLNQRARQLGRSATLDDVTDDDLDGWQSQGFDWIWLLSVWQTGTAARDVSRANPVWRREFEHTLPDLSDDDIAGSGFAITGYTVAAALGGDAALDRLRARLARRGLKLMLDFVPNHMACDHPWVSEHPEYFVSGNEVDLVRAPQNYFYAALPGGRRLFAHGRDPYFPGWPDTIQLDYSQPALQSAMTAELLRIASQCDGVRCDMAMLLEPDVFERTWERSMPPFWPDALAQVRAAHPGFVFMAEVYWDREWSLQQQGFDYCYDKRLYDRLIAGPAPAIRDHLRAGLDYQNHLARFLENHDEPRIAATLDPARHRAAALITFLAPGLRFFHDGQFEGRRVRISPHLVRGPHETPDLALQNFYTRLLQVLQSPAVRDGQWQLIDPRPAWDGNDSHQAIIAMSWSLPESCPLLVAVNYSDHPAQARLPVPWSNLPPQVQLRERFSDAIFDRNAAELAAPGLYIDLPPWGSHVLEVACHP